MYIDSLFVGFGKRIVFSGAQARIITYTNPCSEAILPLKITYYPEAMPLEIALDIEKTVRWFLANDFIPILTENNRKITFVQNQQTSDLMRQSVQATKTLEKFLRMHAEDPKNIELQNERFGEWHLLMQCLQPDKWTLRVELLRTLLEEFRKHLANQDYSMAHMCIESLYKQTNTNFIFKELYADFLSSRRLPEASDLYLQLSKRIIGEESVLYLEKALRSNPENKQALKLVLEAQCSQERTLHCCLTGYLACADKTNACATSIYNRAKKIGDLVNDPIMLQFPRPKSALDTSKSSIRPVDALERSQPWIQPLPRSAPGSPASVRLGQRVVANEVKKPQVEEQSEDFYKHQLIWDKDKAKWLEKLLWLYVEHEEWPRGEFIGRLLFSLISDEAIIKYRLGQGFATCLEKQEKLADACRLYVALAKSEYKHSRTKNVAGCLAEIDRLAVGNGSLEKQDKEVLCLLSRVVNSKHNIDRNGLKKVPDIAFVIPESKAHFGQWAYFQVDDHPHYIACSFTPEIRFLFTKTEVTVDSQSYPLDLPHFLPNELALFRTKAVRWLLAQGYIPTIQDDRVAFCSRVSVDPLIAKASHLGLEAVSRALAQQAYIHAYCLIHMAYNESKMAQGICDLYAEFLLFMQKPKIAMKLFAALAEKEESDERRLYYLQRQLFSACGCKDDTTEKLYKQILQKMQNMQFSKERVALFALHGSLYFQCRDPSKVELLNRFSNKALSVKDVGDFLVPRDLHARISGSSSVISSPRISQAFDRLFVNNGIVLDPDLNKRELAKYLELYNQAEQKDASQNSVQLKMLTQRGAIQPNKICTAARSRALYYLEYALESAREQNLPDVVTVYELIYAKFQMCEVPEAAQFLLCLHAFFYLHTHGFEEAKMYLDRALVLRPNSPLLACASITYFPEHAHDEYAKILAFCANESLVEEHRAFLGADSFKSYLEYCVKEECEKVMEFMRLRQARHVGLVTIDALIRDGHEDTANNYLNNLPPGSVSILKRKVFVYLKRGQLQIVRATLKTLYERYMQKQKAEKMQVITSLLGSLGLKDDDDYVNEFLDQGKDEQAVHLYLDFALGYIRDGEMKKAEDSLSILEALNEDYSMLNSDQRLMLELMRTLLLEAGVQGLNVRDCEK